MKEEDISQGKMSRRKFIIGTAAVVGALSIGGIYNALRSRKSYGSFEESEKDIGTKEIGEFEPLKLRFADKVNIWGSPEDTAKIVYKGSVGLDEASKLLNIDIKSIKKIPGYYDNNGNGIPDYVGATLEDFAKIEYIEFEDEKLIGSPEYKTVNFRGPGFWEGRGIGSVMYYGEDDDKITQFEGCLKTSSGRLVCLADRNADGIIDEVETNVKLGAKVEYVG